MSRRVFLLGLDGLSPDVVEAMLDRLPGFARFCASASCGVLESVFPPVSPVAWGAVYTGQTPERMGIYGWKRLVSPGRLLAVARSDLRVPTLFDHLAAHDRRFGFVGFPLGDPAHPAASAWIRSHFDAAAGDAVAPDRARQLLHDELIDVEFDALPAPEAKRDYPLYRRYRQACDAQRVRAAHRLFEELKLDLMMVHCAYTDNVIHSGHEPRDLELACLGADRLVGHLLERLPPDVVFMIVSDHGVETKRFDVALNRVLQHLGLLELHVDLPDDKVGCDTLESRLRQAGCDAKVIRRQVRAFAALSQAAQRDYLWSRYFLRGTLDNVDFERSLAVALGPYGQIYCDCVEQEKVRQTLLDNRHLLVEPESGRCLLEDVVPVPVTERDGEILPRLRAVFPDDVPLMVKTFPFSLDTPPVAPREHAFRGEHTPRGFFGLRDTAARPQPRSTQSILSCAPTILRLLGIEPPAQMEAPPLPGAAYPPAEATRPAVVEPEDRALTPGQEAEIIERLRALGYYA